MTIADIIREKLQQGFDPEALEVIDQSHLHAGHAGARPEGETHFKVVIVSAAFQGETRVARQRAVNNILKEELAGPVHALSISALTPAEAAQS